MRRSHLAPIGSHHISRCGFSKPLSVLPGQVCETCQIYAHVIEAALQNNNTVQEIKDLLEKGCAFCPPEDRVKCRNFIDVYTGVAIDMLEKMVTPEQLCQYLGFCVPRESLMSAWSFVPGKIARYQPVALTKSVAFCRERQREREE